MIIRNGQRRAVGATDPHKKVIIAKVVCKTAPQWCLPWPSKVHNKGHVCTMCTRGATHGCEGKAWKGPCTREKCVELPGSEPCASGAGADRCAPGATAGPPFQAVCRRPPTWSLPAQEVNAAGNSCLKRDFPSLDLTSGVRALEGG